MRQSQPVGTSSTASRWKSPHFPKCAPRKWTPARQDWKTRLKASGIQEKQRKQYLELEKGLTTKHRLEIEQIYEDHNINNCGDQSMNTTITNEATQRSEEHTSELQSLR